MTYDYICLSCKLTFEQFYKCPIARVNDNTRCPRCQSKKVFRKFSAPRIVFKDGPFDSSPWPSKEIKWFGMHGNDGNAEKCRQTDLKKRTS